MILTKFITFCNAVLRPTTCSSNGVIEANLLYTERLLVSSNPYWTSSWLDCAAVRMVCPPPIQFDEPTRWFRVPPPLSGLSAPPFTIELESFSPEKTGVQRPGSWPKHGDTAGKDYQ